MPKYQLSDSQVSQYHKDGFMFFPGLFDIDEVEPIHIACEEDPEIQGSLTSVIDSYGKVHRTAIWTQLSDALLGVIPRVARVVDTVERLIETECYHWHSKLLRKPPFDEGGLDWHQGYGSWYYDNCLAPKIITCTIAINRNTKDNGCLRIVQGSHLLGRIDTVPMGTTEAAEPVRVKEILSRFKIVDCEMNPGDAVFFHANTLHASDQNKTSQARTLIHCHYNAVDNEPFILSGQEHHRYRPIEKLPDSFIKDGNYDSVIKKQTFLRAEDKENRGHGILLRGKQYTDR